MARVEVRVRLAHLLLAGNDMCRDGGMRSSECVLVVATVLCSALY